MKRIIIAALALLISAPAWANGVHACTTPMANAGFCELGDTLLVWDAPPALADELESVLPGADLDVALMGAVAFDRRTGCTAGAVTLGLCRIATNDVISIALADATLQAFAAEVRPVSFDTVRCSVGTTRIYPGTGTPWSPAIAVDLVATGACAAGQIGQQVANPINAESWAWKWYRDQWRDLVVAARRTAAAATADAGVDTTPDLGDTGN